jgi:uncharacterized protein
MDIGTVTEQITPERFYFAKASGTRSPVMPGDYVQVELSPKEKLIAIVEGISGKLTRKRVTLDRDYLYSCKILDQTGEFELLGLMVQRPDLDTLEQKLNESNDLQLVVGELARHVESVPMSIDGMRLTGSHSCFFGSSGSGKTTLLGLVLEEVLLNVPDIQVIVFDLNSDFSYFDQPKLEKEINGGIGGCKPVEATAIRARQERLSKLSSLLIASPTLQISRFHPQTFLEAIGALAQPSDELLLHHVFSELRRRSIPITISACIESVNQMLKNVKAVQSLFLTSEEIHIAALRLYGGFLRVAEKPLWCTGTSDSLELLERTPRPSFIQFDLGKMPFSDRALFTECALRRLWERNESNRIKTVLVIDEAHNVAPSTPEAWQNKTLEWVNRVSGEGRKYGLFLIVVSQRPAKIHGNTLDNCSNYFVLRLQNKDDLDSLSTSTQEVSPSLLSRVSAFKQHEALVFGGAMHPAIVRTGRRVMR